jgi:hypothetical protein
MMTERKGLCPYISRYLVGRLRREQVSPIQNAAHYLIRCVNALN